MPCFMVSKINHLVMTLGYTFAKQPSIASWNTCEDQWLNKINTKFDIKSTIFPRVKQILRTFRS